MKLLAPTKKLGRPCSTDAGETRERLIHEARASFATIGYDATTNRTVAAAAGITTGAIYHYFPSKLDMYVASFEQVQNMVTEAVVAAAAPCAAPDDDVVGQPQPPAGRHVDQPVVGRHRHAGRGGAGAVCGLGGHRSVE